MNIFEVLTLGKGRLNEENTSALLGYYLNPSQNHGLRDFFLCQFLGLVAKQCNQPDRFEEILNHFYLAEIIYEVSYTSDEFRRTIDIEVRLGIGEKGTFSEKHRVIIENKISTMSAQEDQLREEFILVRGYLAQHQNSAQITTVFLTPPGNHSNVRVEFDTLTNEELGQHKKAWLLWHDETNSGESITSLIQQIVSNEHCKLDNNHLKDFSAFIRANMTSNQNNTEKRQSRQDFENDMVVDEVVAELSSGRYIIRKYESTTIKIYHVDTNREVDNTKGMLRKINQELGLGVNLNNSTGTEKITRQLGAHIIKALKARGY